MDNEKNDLRENESQNENEQSILDALIEIAPLIQQLFTVDNMVGITDTEKFLAYVPGKELNIGDAVGQPIIKGDAIDQAINSGKTCVEKFPDGIEGVPCKGIGVPVRDKEGNVIGAIGLGVSLKTQEALSEASNSIAATSQQISTTSQDIAGSAGNLATDVNSLLKFGQEIQDQVGETNKVLEFLNNIASNTNLLALNASIEAARAGEQGRGFSVVASEMQKLSENSTNYLKDVDRILKSVKENIDKIVTKISETSEISQGQASATEEISASIEQLTSAAQEIEKISHII